MAAIDWTAEAREILSVFKPRPKLTISQWADRERKLSPEASSEPGQWHTERAEYMREIMDSIGDPRVHTVVVMSASQVGKTEVLLNAVGFYIDHDPSPMLFVMPTLEMADGLSKDRLAAMLRDTPALRGKVGDARARDSGNTLLHKQFAGGHITLCGSNSPASLASRPIRIVFCDEVDRYDPSAGSEGDPVSLAKKRTTTYWNRKLILTSTPGLKGLSRIEAAYNESDQRHFEVPCGDCGEFQRLQWRQVHWNKDLDANGKTLAHHPETAHYLCEHCGSLWNDVARWAAVRRGRWQATKPLDGVAGFHLNEIYSSWVPLVDMVKDFLSSLGDSSRQQAFTNMSLGETWEEAYEKIDGNPLLARRENYGPDSLPDAIDFLTAGVDTQGNRLELHVWGFRAGEEMWAVDYQVPYGDPAQQAIWADLDHLLLTRYRTQSGRELKIQACCIDAGGHHGQQVVNFCNARFGRRIFATHGMAGARRIWPLRASRTKNNGQVFMIGVDMAKDAIYGRLRNTTPGSPGYVHFPAAAWCDEEYFTQLTAEKIITRWRMGRALRVWDKPKAARNEAWDTAVLALAAMHAVTRTRDTMVAAPRAPLPGQPQPPPSPFPRPVSGSAQERAERLAKRLAQ